MKTFLILAFITLGTLTKSAEAAFLLHCDVALSITDGEFSEQKRIIFELQYIEDKPITRGRLYTYGCFGNAIEELYSETSKFSADFDGDLVNGIFNDLSMKTGEHHLQLSLNLVYSGKDLGNQNPIYFNVNGTIKSLDNPTFEFDHAAGQCILDLNS